MLANNLSIGNFILYSGSAITFSSNIMQFLASLGGMRERSSHVDDFRSFMDIPNPDEGKKTVPIPRRTSMFSSLRMFRSGTEGKTNTR